MPQETTFDLRSNVNALVSIPPESIYTPGGDVNGDWKDCSAFKGPIQALCAVGAVNLGATAQDVEFELEEADDVSGTNGQRVAVQTPAILIADDTAAFLTGQTTKPFCRVIVQDTLSSLTGGTTPTQDVVAIIVGQKSSF